MSLRDALYNMEISILHLSYHMLVLRILYMYNMILMHIFLLFQILLENYSCHTIEAHHISL